jgi:UDP-2-acetamido-3-amino-2,3-dideoxy-glucuronate N-acetyltransferase
MNTRIVCVGFGYWGKNVARNLHELGVLRGICDTSPDSRKRARDNYPDQIIYESYEAVLRDDRVDAVAISTPAATHAELSVQALRAERDVFVEKPLALKYEDGQEMVHLAERKNQILMVGHLLEHHPAVLKLSELVHEGRLGRLQYIYSNRLNLGKFRREENILWSFAPHDISVILRLIGNKPIEVAATGGGYLQPNVADTTVTNLLFDNGVRGHIFVSWLHPYKEQRLVVVGSKKMAVFNDQSEPDQKLILYDQGADWVDNKPVPRTNGGEPVRYAYREPLRSELEHFVTCVDTRQQPATDGHNGLRVLEVLEAAQQSLQTGGTRVPLFQPASAISAA